MLHSHAQVDGLNVATVVSQFSLVTMQAQLQSFDTTNGFAGSAHGSH